MKTLPSVRKAFVLQGELAPLLLAEVKGLFESRPKSWHFEYRAKGDESFALKAESGKVMTLGALEDFVGCMVVVPTWADIAAAVEFIDGFFETLYRRPFSDDETVKRSSDFPFDDLRLYGKLRPPQDLPGRPIDNIVFEIQVKTFLQHAWSIATHDLVYKYGRVSWARNRVAAQVKALLEHAELSIGSIAELEKSGQLYGEGFPENEQQRIADLLSNEWMADELPADRRRLATNVWQLLECCQLSHEDLLEVISRGKVDSNGVHPISLSPFQTILLYLARFRSANLRSLLDGSTELRSPYRIPVADEVLDLLSLAKGEAKRAL